MSLNKQEKERQHCIVSFQVYSVSQLHQNTKKIPKKPIIKMGNQGSIYRVVLMDENA
jgi:hypothetical protein